MNNGKLPDGVRILNYKQSDTTADVSSVPVLLKDSTLTELQFGDDSPFFKVQSIDYPAAGTGGIYDKSFFESFINITKTRPIAGSKRGHEYTSRPSSDFYMVGGSLVENSVDSGTAHFLMYIPKHGDTTDNLGFIRDARAGIVNFSLVSSPEYENKQGPDGKEQKHFTMTRGYERNDAVEYGAGAMAQVVNSNEIINYELAKELAINGQFIREDKSDEVFVKGKVSYSMLRRKVSNASCENKAEIGEILSIIDKQKNGGKLVELKEAIEMVTNAVKNGAVSFFDIVKNCGTENMIRNESDDKAVTIANSVISKLGDKPMEMLDSILAENKANKDATVINSVVSVFGAAKIKRGDTESDNPAYSYALAKCNGKTGDALKNEIEELKTDSVMLAIRGNTADQNSAMNVIVNGGNAKAVKNEKTFNGVTVETIGGK